MFSGLSVKPRYEVQDFFSGKNKLQRDLFLQAFAAIEKLPVDDHRSFYQIAGIHGLPYEPYRGSVNEDYPWRESNESWGGYCHHSSVLFPTWHRAYMLLIERVLRDEALALAKQYNASLRDSYLAAAKSMRFPYWDWAANRVSKRGIPDIFRYRTVNVNVPPNANKKSITNPLRAFEAPLDIGTPQVCVGFAMSTPKVHHHVILSLGAHLLVIEPIVPLEPSPHPQSACSVMFCSLLKDV